MDLSAIPNEKLEQINKLYLEYDGRYIDSNFVNNITENNIVLPDQLDVAYLVLDMLDDKDIKNLYLSSTENKNKIYNYLIDRFIVNYSLDLNSLNLNVKTLLNIHQLIKKYNLTSDLINELIVYNLQEVEILSLLKLISIKYNIYPTMFLY